MPYEKSFKISLDQARTLFDILTYDDIVYSSLDLVASIANHYNELHDEYRDIDWCWVYGVKQRGDLKYYSYTTPMTPMPTSKWVTLADACERINP